MNKRLSQVARINMEKIIASLYIDRIRELAAKDKNFFENVPGFLINPKTIALFWFDQHIAISFEGEDCEKSLIAPLRPKFVHRIFFSKHEKTYVFSAVSGLDLKKSAEENDFIAELSLLMISGEMSRRGFLFSESTLTDLLELGWRIEALNTTGVVLGFAECAIPKNKSFNFQNIFIFKKNNGGGVSSHHIKWLEVIPYKIDFDSQGEICAISGNSSIIEKAADNASLKKFFIPTSYHQVKFHAINRFIEIWGYASTKETAITQFLKDDKHKFILTMHFGAKNIYSELTCFKFDQPAEAVRPDFFIEKTNGVCDIVEFKLPRVTKPIVVGPKNRRRFASWFSTHLAQASAYRRYFSDPRHRMGMREKHGLTVETPNITLVIGRRFDVNTSEVRMLLSEHSGIDLMSYDDLVDGVVAQLYW
jgi:hypothetical protein